MPFMIGLMIAAVILWMAGGRKRRDARRRTNDEIATTLKTGLPSGDTALGRKAHEVAVAQAAKLIAPPPVHGTARWGGPEDATPLMDGNLLRGVSGSRGLRLGTLQTADGQDSGLPVVARYPGHLLTVAGTGQGKSATQIVENMLTYTGSVVVIDPKGELYDLTAERRRQMGRVYRLAPLARLGEPTDRYNPLAELGSDRELGSRARHLAEMLIVRQGQKGAAEASFFENEAINLLTAVIMSVVELASNAKPAKIPTLAEVRRICTLPILAGRDKRDPKVREYLEDVLQLMTRSRHTYVRSQGALFASYEQKLLGSFLSELNSNLAFFDGHPGFAEAMAENDFYFSDLARETTTIYLTIPLKDMATSYRYLRAMVGMAFAALDEQRDATDATVLFILDEFPALRDMEFMRDAVAQMRSAGAWFWFFVQDVAQIQGVYKEWANVFLSQTDHQVFFGAVADPQTKKHISSALGVGTYAYRDPNVNWSQSVGLNDSENQSPMQLGGVGSGRNVGQSVNVSDAVVLAARSLLTPFEVGTFLSTRQPGENYPNTAILFSKQAGGYPLKLLRQHWQHSEALQLLAPPVLPTPSVLSRLMKKVT